MIDYLERIFAPASGAEEETEAPLKKGDVMESETVEFRVPNIPAEDERETVSTKERADVEVTGRVRPFLPGENPENMKIPMPEEHSGVFEGERVWTAPKTAPTVEAGEELERRLRRESRRYDSGFYRY